MRTRGHNRVAAINRRSHPDRHHRHLPSTNTSPQRPTLGRPLPPRPYLEAPGERMPLPRASLRSDRL